MTKRPLSFISATFVFGIFTALYDLNIVLIFLLLAAFFVAGLFINKKFSFGAFIILAFMLLGTLRVDLAEILRNNEVNTLIAKTSSVQMTVTDFSDGKNTVAQMKKDGRTYKVYLNIKNKPSLLPGDIIKGEFSFREPNYDKVNINGFSSYLSSRGIYICAYADSVHITGIEKAFPSGWIFSIRRYVNELGKTCFKNNTRALFNAMVLGDKSLIEEDLEKSLRVAGISHIAVVSGMHLSIVISVLLLFLTHLFGKRRFGYLLAIFASIIITLVTGAGASVVRALITSILFCISKMLYRQIDSVTSLSFAVLVMCVINPFVIMNLGFILSVASVAGILLFYPKTAYYIKKIIPGNTGDVISLSLSAQLIVTPFLICFFSSFSLYSLLANVLVSFFASGLVICGIIFCFFSKIPFLSDALDFMIELFSSAVEVVSERILELPFAELKFGYFSGAFCVLWIIMLSVLFSAKAKEFSFKRVFSLFIAVIILTSSFIYKKQSTNIHVYTYGESSMALFCTPKASFLMDCPDIYDAKTLCESISSDAFTYGILTNENSDNMIDFAKQGGIKTIVAYAPLFTDDFIEETTASLRQTGVRAEFIDTGSFLCGDRFSLEYILLNEGNEKAVPKINYNNKSIVTLQGLGSKEIDLLSENSVKINCDYLILPFKSYGRGFDPLRLCSGKIISAEKIYHQRNKKTVNFY